MQLKGRTAIVTGASMGIGAETAKALADRGAKVWAVARSENRLTDVAKHSDSIHPLVADLCVEEDRARVAEVCGDVDILVNNAGLGTFGLVESMPAEEVRHLFELNVMALIDMSQRVLPSMLARGRGHICNVGSSISYVASPPLTVYAATKFAVAGFTDGLRREVGNRGVKVSLIQPGPVKTAFWDRAAAGDRPDASADAGAGVPPTWISSAIVRAIRCDRIPGYATVAVPRPLGLGRVMDLPGVSLGVDLMAGFSNHLGGHRAARPH